MSTTEEQQAQAVIAAINTALQAAPYPPGASQQPSDRIAYDYDELPEVFPTSGYVLIDVTRRYIEGFRGGGPHGMRAGRLGTRYVGKSVTDTRSMRNRVRSALEDVTLTISGQPVGPFRFESEEPIGPHDEQGWYEGADTWTYANPA